MPQLSQTALINALAPEQQEALARILCWHKDSQEQVFHLAGYAGTGKTQLVVTLNNLLYDVQYAAFTGKAASVLHQRGADNAMTLHSLLYGAPVVEKQNGREVLKWFRHGYVEANLIIADECSMIGQELGRDLIETNQRILVTGDAIQLPPINDAPVFGDNPDFVLTQIHRQVAGSQPLRMATAIRTDEEIDGPVPFDLNTILGADIVICALNNTRRWINRKIRLARGIDTRSPIVGDRVLCFRNNGMSGVLNGTLWNIKEIKGYKNDIYHLALRDEVNNRAFVRVPSDCFVIGRQAIDVPREYDVFDFGYCITCHKAQGSEWPWVVVIDETTTPGFAKIAPRNLTPTEFRKRWLYTAATRAREAVMLMKPPF